MKMEGTSLKEETFILVSSVCRCTLDIQQQFVLFGAGYHCAIEAGNAQGISRASLVGTRDFVVYISMRRRASGKRPIGLLTRTKKPHLDSMAPCTNPRETRSFASSVIRAFWKETLHLQSKLLLTWTSEFMNAAKLRSRGTGAESALAELLSLRRSWCKKTAEPKAVIAII